MRLFRNLLLFFILVSIYSSCSNKQYQTLFEKRSNIPDSSAHRSAITLDSYLIQPQDILQVRNLQNISFVVDQSPSSNGTGSGTTSSQGQTYQVEEDGTVALPNIGHIQVVGLTRSQAEKKVEHVYKDSLLRNPIIELKIVNLKVTLLGEVKSQGNYPLIKDKTFLVEVLGEAGGLTEKADQSNIKIIRGDEKNPKVTVADLDNINSINDPNNVLQNGDIIYISESKRAARGDNLQNFSTVFSPVLILINTFLVVLTLARR